MNMRLKVGVIGCGAISERLHVPDLHASPNAEIVALCDIKQAKAKKLAEAYAPDAAVYGDYKALLANPGVQGVVVALPNYLHGPVTVAAAKAGKHVLVEKPMATSLSEAKGMIAAATKSGTLLMVNQSQRLYASTRKAKEVLESGILGKILYVVGMFGHSGPDIWSPEGKWFFKKKEARFGAMADLGVHRVDLIRYLTGKKIVDISGFCECLEKPHCDVDDNFAAAIKFDDGTIGMVGSSWTAKGLGSDFTIFHCANGTLRVNLWPGQPCVAHLLSPKTEMVLEIPPPLNTYEGSWGLDVGGAFARAALGLEAPFCSGEEGMRSLAVILAAEKAAQTRRTVKVSY